MRGKHQHSNHFPTLELMISEVDFSCVTGQFSAFFFTNIVKKTVSARQWQNLTERAFRIKISVGM